LARDTRLILCARYRKRFPRTRFVWLMGLNNMRQMPRWRDWPDIFHLVPVAVFRAPPMLPDVGLERRRSGLAVIGNPPSAVKFLRGKKRPRGW